MPKSSVGQGGAAFTPDPRRARRILFLVAGSIALALGTLGVVLPVLPTTPFLLLAAYCYARSSERLHSWLLANRVFGPHLHDYFAGKGVSSRVKAGVLVFLWAMIALSSVVFVPIWWVRIVMVVVGVGVTVHILRMRTKRPEPPLLGSGEERKSDPPAQRMPES